ncbi:hypothetical protein SANTM175S_06146 [Streptomyces antimycoticus]
MRWCSRRCRICRSIRTAAPSTRPRSSSRASPSTVTRGRRTRSPTPGSSRPRRTATSSPRCCAPSTTTRSPTRSTNSSSGRGWWASWADTLWSAAPTGSRAPPASGGPWHGPVSRSRRAAGRVRWRPRTWAPTRPRTRTRCWTRRSNCSARRPRSGRPSGRGPRPPSRCASAGRTAVRRSASPPGSTDTSRPARSPRTSPSTSPTPPGRTGCWRARPRAWSSCRAPPEPSRRSSTTRRRTTTSRAVSPPRWCWWTGTTGPGGCPPGRYSKRSRRDGP